MKRFFFCLSALSLWALPQAPLVQEGEVAFLNGSKQSLEMRASDGAIIDWKDFSIELGERVEFMQPSVDATVMNRVVDAYPSRLLGRLEGNGQIVLVNLNGICVGKEGSIHTASFVASAFDVHQGILVNQGTIRCNHVDLRGTQIHNEGTIEAKRVWIEGAQTVRLDGIINADGRVGGEVIARSGGAIGFYGYISARGAERGGNVEISSKGHLDYKGLADLGAESGVFGTVLIDPTDIFINTNADSAGVVVGPVYTIPPAVSVDVNNGNLVMQLGLSNVTISSNTLGGGTGNITVNAPITGWVANTILTLDTTGTGVGSIIVNDVISNAAAGTVVLTADGDINVLGIGQIDMNNLGAGSVSAVAQGNIDINGNPTSIQVGTGKILLRANGNVTVEKQVSAVLVDAAPATAQITVQADADLNNVGTLQIIPSAISGAAVLTQDGSILLEGFDVLIGDLSAISGTNCAAQNTGNITINARNDYVQAAGSVVGASTIVRASNGNLIASVHRNASFLGGTADSCNALAQATATPLPAFLTFAIGNDLLIRGGTAVDTDSGIDGVTAGFMMLGKETTTTVLVGRNVTVQQQAGATNTECVIVGTMNNMVRVGGNFFAQGGFDPTAITIFLSALPGTINSIFCNGNMVFQNEVTPPLFEAGPLFNSDSTDLRAGGDIQIGSPIDKTATGGYIFVESDTSIANLWTATPNATVPGTGNPAIIAGTPLAAPAPVVPNGLGGVIIDTGPLGSQTWATASGDITVLSRDRSTLGTPVDITLGSASNQIVLSTISGNLEVNGFRNISANTGASTTGNIFFRSMNNMTINAPFTGNNVVLVCDEQGPNGMIGGGAFTLTATGSLTAARLQIFTARQQLNSISGVLNLNGTTFFPGTLFVDTDTEHWCVYFGGPGSGFAGPAYTIFYKDCVQQLTSQAMIIVDQFLVDLHPYNEFPGWMERFFVGYPNDPEPTPYYLRRRNLDIINTPKSYTVLLAH